ncbi:copper resistance protein B [Erythrobacter aureus]|uniref:copper resistance protein B n=1 Tax=Erythrobacter aureus TaxID=2182384 RepID=UPI003A9436B2
MRTVIAFAIVAVPVPALAQHEGHGQPEGEKPVDHSAMDHSQMDHGAVAATSGGPVLQGLKLDIPKPPEAPPPPAAGSGPPRAADAIWGAEAMRESREALARENGGMTLFWVQGDRLELRSREGHDGFLWDIQAWYGGDIDKLWVKTEGEGEVNGPLEDAEVQALWSHAIGPWFDLQAGVRQDLTGPERTHAVIGVQGLAPYLFEVDAAAFVSNKGDITARIEAELDQRITQSLILQPRMELGLSAQDIPELGVGAGIDHFEAGLRLRYEFAPEFAPYVGIEQEWKLGDSADFARLEGEDLSVTSVVVGVRFWF